MTSIMFGRAPAFVSLAVCLLVAADLSCAHAGPDTCGGYSVERQWNKRFRVTVTAKATEPPQWKLGEDGNPSAASFGGASLDAAQALYTRVARQRCIDLGYREGTADGHLQWHADKQVTSVSTCADPGAPGKRYYAIRIWGDRLTCEYVYPL